MSTTKENFTAQHTVSGVSLDYIEPCLSEKGGRRYKPAQGCRRRKEGGK